VKETPAYCRLRENSAETVSLARPFRRRRASTLRPFFVAMRVRNPCLFRRFRRLGWYVRFIEFLVWWDPKTILKSAEKRGGEYRVHGPRPSTGGRRFRPRADPVERERRDC
jgi:hypothetical protein